MPLSNDCLIFHAVSSVFSLLYCLMIFTCYEPSLAVHIHKHNQMYSGAIIRWQFSEIWYIWPYGLTCFQNLHYHLQFWKHILKTDFLVWFPVELFNDGHSNEIWRSEEEYSIFISTRRQIHGHRQDLRITWGAAGVLQHQHPQAWASETGHMSPTCGWTQPTLPVADVLWPLGKHQGITYSTTASHSPHITGYSLESHPVFKKKKTNLKDVYLFFSYWKSWLEP